MTEQEKALVAAVRNHPLVGNGTCTSVSECLDDRDLLDFFRREGVTTEKAAVKWAVDYEDMWIEQNLNARWGDDDDPQMQMHREWEKAKKEHGL